MIAKHEKEVWYLVDRTRTFGGFATIINGRTFHRKTRLLALKALRYYLRKALVKCETDLAIESATVRGKRELQRVKKA